ncbi:hypothetical protein PMAYCL1PPCAC_27249, partial [Pristionchus mayeri]
ISRMKVFDIILLLLFVLSSEVAPGKDPEHSGSKKAFFREKRFFLSLGKKLPLSRNMVVHDQLSPNQNALRSSSTCPHWQTTKMECTEIISEHPMSKL